MSNAASLAGHSGVRLFDSDGDAIDIADLFGTPVDFAGKRAFNTTFGEAVVGSLNDNISCQFQYSNSTRDVLATTSGSGTTSNANSMAAVNITGAVGSSTLTSRDSVRYRPGHECVAQFTSLYEGAQSGVKQYHGFLNSVDGACFGTQDGVFGVYIIENSVETFIPSSSFSESAYTGLGFVHDPSKLNLYMVQYGWLGVAPISFSMYMGHLLGWRVVHVHDRVNISTSPHLGNPSLPLAVKVARASGSGSAASVRTASWRAGVVAGEQEVNSSERWFARTQLDLSFAGTANIRYNALTLNNKATYQGKTNHVMLELGIVAFSNSTNRTLAIYGSKGSTLTGAAAAIDVDADNSVCSYQTGGTVTGGVQGPATIQLNNQASRIDVRGTGILVYPGESFTFEVVGSQSFTGTFSMSARWRELF